MLNKIQKYIGIAKEIKEINEDENTEEQSGMLKSITNNIQNSIEVETDYKMFFIFIAIGMGFICLSLMFLPIILLSPQKFVTLFSIGSIVSLSSFIFVYGTQGYISMLFSPERKWFSMLYLVSIFVGLYYAFFHSYYLVSIICALIQLITLIIFTLTFIPGGSSGISLLVGMLRMPFNSLWMRITGRSYLPN